MSDSGPSDAKRPPNKELYGIIQELEDLASEDNVDAFILYLYLILLAKLMETWSCTNTGS